MNVVDLIVALTTVSWLSFSLYRMFLTDEFRNSTTSIHWLACMPILIYETLSRYWFWLCRFGYLLDSHFILNLQDNLTTASNGSDSSQKSFHRSNEGQVSSIRFADSIIGNLGAQLRDGSHEDDIEDGINTNDFRGSDPTQIDEEARADTTMD